jgi:hypothetical protein
MRTSHNDASVWRTAGALPEGSPGSIAATYSTMTSDARTLVSSDAGSAKRSMTDPPIYSEAQTPEEHESQQKRDEESSKD